MFKWPDIEMKLLDIVEYPSDPQDMANRLGLSMEEYQDMVTTAMRRDSATMLDVLGFKTKMSDYAKTLPSWGTALNQLAKVMGFSEDET